MGLRSRKYPRSGKENTNNVIKDYDLKNEDDVLACGMQTEPFSNKFNSVMSTFNLENNEVNPVAQICNHLEGNFDKRELAFLLGKKMLIEQLDRAVAEANKKSNQ